MVLNNKKIAFSLLVVTVAVSLSGCAHWSKRSRNTAIGATVGAVGGSVLTGGSTLGTLGGAAAGGIIGHQINK